MKNTNPIIEIQSIGWWGRFPLYQAKVGTGSSDCIIVRRVRKFRVGMFIKFARRSDVRSMCVGCTPKWHSGLISRLDNDRIFVDYF